PALPPAMTELFNQVAIGLALIQDSRLLYANAPLAEIFGYGPAEFLRLEGLAELAVAEDRALLDDTLRRLLAGEAGPMPCIFRGRRRDGAAIDVELAGSTLENAGRGAMLIQLSDVTERRILAARAIEAEARHRRSERLLDGAEVFLWEEDLSEV